MNVSGDFIIGQYFDESTKSFTLGKSFVGKITEVNIWGMFLNLDTIVTMSRDCSSSRGYILSWSSFRDGFHGDVQLIETSECLVPGKILHVKYIYPS